MKIFFEEKDMVSFGEYLLSDERKELILNHPEFEGRTEEALKDVYEADLTNWSRKQQQG